jgi:ribosomal protein S21
MASPHSEAAQHQDSQSENSGGKDTQIRKTLHQLDQENLELEAKEELLNNALRKLKEDESCLREAIKEESTASQPPSQKRTAKDAEAVRRLEQALLESSSDDETNDSS